MTVDAALRQQAEQRILDHVEGERARTPSVHRVTAATIAALFIAGCGSGHRSAPSTASVAQPSSPMTLEQAFVRVVKETQPQVAQIRTGAGLGSGVIYDEKGDIVTNAHVVAGATSLQVTFADGTRQPARLVGSYVPDDLAVISVGALAGLKPARFADSSRVEVGDIVLAVGNPLGLQSSVTDGIVSALGRTVSEGQGVVLPNAIQTSATINPGNSGGALVDLGARVIGIPTLAAGNPQTGSAAAGIGFAIPSNVVRDIAGQIVQHGRVVNSHRAALGVNLADNLVRPGAVVAAVQRGGPADQAGITVGDSIDTIDGAPVASADDLATALARLRPGQRIELSLMRSDGSTSTKTVTLGELPAS
jgi:putative serine protease PepD